MLLFSEIISLMKKYMGYFLLVCSMIISSVYAAESCPYCDATSSETDIKTVIKGSVVDTKGPIQQLIKIFLPNRPTGETTMSYIQYILDTALGLAALVSLVVLIYGFYGILFGSSQDGIKNAQKTVKGSLIAITLLGASWTIVRALFYVVTKLQ